MGFLGIAVGFGIQQPFVAIMTVRSPFFRNTMPMKMAVVFTLSSTMRANGDFQVFSPKDISLAISVVALGSAVGSSAFMATSATLFQNRLEADIHKFSPGTNVTLLANQGLSDLRKAIGPDRLKEVIFGYNEAVVQTLYVPLGLGLLTIVASMFTEVKSTKKRD